MIIRLEKALEQERKINKFIDPLSKTTFYQLFSGNKIISSLTENLEQNMWQRLYWINFIATKDLIVSSESSHFKSEEVAYLKKENQFCFRTRFYIQLALQKNPASV